jgi:hypothetical protein
MDDSVEFHAPQLFETIAEIQTESQLEKVS